MFYLLCALLICHVGGPGTTSQAQPVVDQFLRQLEKTAGWQPDSLSGAYFEQLPGCRKYLAENKPRIGAFDLATFLKHQKAWGLAAIAHMGKADAKHYYLLVRKGSYSTLESLKGKKLISSLAADPEFLSKIIFGKKVDAAKHFQLNHSRQPLQGIRKVARGQADATLVDETAYQHLSELKLPTTLEAIYVSPPLPGLTLAAIFSNEAKTQKLAEQLSGVIPNLCAGVGKSLCTNFQIERFERVKKGIYEKLAKEYQ
ncbi:MAG: PhnD/SsuA/transferrin family substrate-binding protein [Pseudomonadota bacterium]